ncbi:MAG TPA: hypothetical protein PLT51_00745 [Candidatus Dojkabacteria bacterium]|jgi:hypothetical protein|nr:hypothetical protein [Candidatus Dojkabacteria bacterium]
MEEKPLTKEEHNLHIATRFKKTQQEKEQAKAAKAAWKKSLKNDETKR